MTVGWEGGWLLGIAGAAAGAAAGAVTGWLFARWTLPDLVKRDREPARAAQQLPLAFAVLFALFGAYTWAQEPETLDQAREVGIGWILLALFLLALPGTLVGRPFLGLLVMSPLVLVILVPTVASVNVAWEGGWVLAIVGAAVGAAAGAVNGWLFNRWIMPEYDKRRARQNAARPPGSRDDPGSGGSMAEQCAEPSICPTCKASLREEGLLFRERGMLFCKRCGTINWSDMAAALIGLLAIMGLGALAVWGSYSIAWTVASWIVFFLGVGILGLCTLLLTVVVIDIGRAKQLASSWRRNGARDGNGDRP
jgi:hypothetical protein